MFCGLVACLLSGCQPASNASDRKSSLQIETFRARIDSVPNRMSFISYLSSNFDAVIQPRVNGFLASRHFSSGMPVRRGQLLFRIDPEQLSTSMLAAEAELESARAQAVEARNNYERAVPLARINAISQSQLDQYTAQYRAAEAAVRSAEQALRNASLNVGYTELRSPIDGIAAHAEAHVGDYVGPGTQFNVLTTVSNTDTVSVDVAIPMSQYLRIVGNRTPLADNGELLSDIRLTLADGTRYPLPGCYSYTQRCVLQSLNLASVWVVAEDGTVSYRRVTPGPVYGGMWCIAEGLEAGETVAASGLQKLHDGDKVSLPKS